MTDAQNPIYAQLKSAIEFELEAFGDCAEARFSDDVSFEEVQTLFGAIAAEKGLRDATIAQSDSGRGTMDVVMSWVEVE